MFKSVSKLWLELQDEAQLLNYLNKIAVSLKPFLVSQAKMFSEACLESLLEAAEVKTDNQRIAASSGMADVTHTHSSAGSDLMKLTHQVSSTGYDKEPGLR